MTRAANYLIIQIRQYISPSYRTQDGLLLITYGMDVNFSWTTVRLEFSTNDIEEIKYKGLKNYMKERENRPYHFGEGVDDDYFQKD